MEKGVYELFEKFVGYIHIKHGVTRYTRYHATRELAWKAVDALRVKMIEEYEAA